MGIITGIGDKNNNENVITPKIDADINNYILNKNCIVEGLQVIGNTLTAGMCVLKGYRGILENDITLETNTYVYGKFTLNFDNEITDGFDIEFTDTEHIEPTEISSAGTYYLLLYTYENGAYILNPELGTPNYPANSYQADESDFLLPNGVISSTATATTQEVNCHDELDEDNEINKYVATTEYVHNQIEEEINFGSQTINITNGTKNIGTITFYRKARVVRAIMSALDFPYIGESSLPNFTIPSGFIPNEQISFLQIQPYYESGTPPTLKYRLLKFSISTTGSVSVVNSINYLSGLTSSSIAFGYRL